ncbi:MAG TPA: methionine--tRNA ligase [Candidatus Paceibacterota bacterium]
MKKTFYITTTLPYVNAEPHVGFATEIIRADAIARAKKLQGFEVFFNTGTDEHGQKLYEGAIKEGKDTQDYVDFYAKRFRDLTPILGISEDVHFIRTTDEHHKKAAQEFWKRCDQNGYIYKKNYEAKYCVGCELEKTDSELVDGRCPIHPGKELEIRSEENYFFKWSAFGDKLLALYEQNPTLVVPDFRFNEIKAFVERGLQDFSISRLKSKMSWGIPVPSDEDHVMYVWFDALVNYISTLGWPESEGDASGEFEKFWKNGTPVQYCGKDNLRQQSAMWQAMLMAAGLPPTNKIIINGFLTGEGGIKMSKSIGNVVSPYDAVEQFGTEALRYFCLAELSSFEDSPFTMERLKDSYNAKLANGIGNLTSRIMKMAETHLPGPVDVTAQALSDEYFALFDAYDFVKLTQYIWSHVQGLDAFIQEQKPFSVVKTDKEAGVALIQELVGKLYAIGLMLEPILPDTSRKIKELVKENKMPAEPLFLRKE